MEAKGSIQEARHVAKETLESLRSAKRAWDTASEGPTGMAGFACFLIGQQIEGVARSVGEETAPEAFAASLQPAMEGLCKTLELVMKQEGRPAGADHAASLTKAVIDAFWLNYASYL